MSRLETPEVFPPRRDILALALLLLTVPDAAGARDIESEVNARFRGRAVVVTVGIASSCDGFYNDNVVRCATASCRCRGRVGGCA